MMIPDLSAPRAPALYGLPTPHDLAAVLTPELRRLPGGNGSRRALLVTAHIRPKAPGCPHSTPGNRAMIAVTAVANRSSQLPDSVA